MMETLTNMFKSLLHISIISSILIVAVIVLRQVIYRKVSARYIYLLWIVVLLRLIFPFSVSSFFSVENYLNEEIIYFDETEKEVIYTQAVDDKMLTYGTLKKDVFKAPSAAEKNYRILTYIWLFGIFVVMFIPIISYITLKRALGEDEIPKDDVVRYALTDASRKIGVQRYIKVVYSYYVDAPALIGVIWPIVILPYDKKGADYETLLKIFLHELVHYYKHHLLLQWIFWCVKAVYWFNPLIWLAHYIMKQDAELACDEAVIQILGDDEKSEYGHVLIDIAENSDHNPHTVHAAGLLNKKSELQKRILRLNNMPKPSMVLKGLGIVFIIMMLPLFFTVRAKEIVVIEDKVISDQFTDDAKTADYVTIRPLEYTYNTKTDELELVIDYSIDEAFFNTLEGQVAIVPGFEIDFPGSVNSEARRQQLQPEDMEVLQDNNKGQIKYIFILKDYNEETYKKPRLTFSEMQIQVGIGEEVIMLTEDYIPYKYALSNDLEITINQWDKDEERNRLSIAYDVETYEHLFVDIDSWFTGYDSEGMAYNVESVSGQLSEEKVEYDIKFRTGVEAIESIEMSIKGYTVYLGTIRGLVPNEQDDMIWRFDIHTGEGAYE